MFRPSPGHLLSPASYQAEVLYLYLPMDITEAGDTITGILPPIKDLCQRCMCAPEAYSRKTQSTKFALVTNNLTQCSQSEHSQHSSLYFHIT